MSPNEAQLRAALRGGEGPGLDVDRVITRAVQAGRDRHARRLRVASVTAVVAAVTGLGVTAGVLASRPAPRDNSAASAGSQPANGPAQPSGGGAPANGDLSSPAVPAAPGPLRNAASAPCPTALPRLDAARATGHALLAGPVESFKVCAYTTGDGRPLTAADGSIVAAIYTGGAATQLAASLEAAPLAPDQRQCPLDGTADSRSVAIIPVSAAGSALAPITSELRQNPCNVAITNGTAVRYDWTPPPAMAAFLAALGLPSAPGAATPGGTGRASGSPIHS